MTSRFARGMGVGLAATLALALTACGGSTAAPEGVSGEDYDGPAVEITFWHGWTGGAAPTIVPKLIDQFNAEHENITVKNVPQEWADISSKMPLAIKAGKGPDVAVLHGDDLATYAAQNLLQPADEIISGLGYDDGDFPPGVFEMGDFRDAQYAIPWSVTPLGLFVNKDVMAKADLTEIPADREGYLAALDALKAVDVQGEWVDGYVFTGTFEFQSLLWQFGGDLYDENVEEATFNSEAGVEALTWMTELVDKGYSPKNVAQDGNIKALLAGQTAFNWNGVWQTTNTAFGDLDWEAAAVPQIGDEKAVWSSSTHWVFPANKGQDADKTSAAATFVKWMNDNSVGWAETGELPAANTVREDPSLLETYPALEPFMEQLDYAHYETVSPGINEANALITTAINEALTGKKTPKQALDDAKKKADAVIASNQEKYGD
ncbi:MULTISPECIES: ABC transporter substrate-binding protein [unclassified Microbacterium]|uniref:ABC transporter substrate-binding protein n=1 Tax=unclassified Microbacterium TaxID=2609290 RepID=UPI00387061FB